MKGVGMMRIARQNLTVDRLGLAQTSCLVMAKRVGEHVLQRRGGKGIGRGIHGPPPVYRHVNPIQNSTVQPRFSRSSTHAGGDSRLFQRRSSFSRRGRSARNSGTRVNLLARRSR